MRTLARSSTRSSADTALLLAKVGPHAGKPGKHILHLSQFYLGLGLSGLRPGGKNIEDQVTAVEDLDLQHLFQVAQLTRAEFVVKNDHVRLVFGHIQPDLFQLSLPYKGSGMRMIQFLRKFPQRNCSGCFGQKSQLVHVFFYLVFFLVFLHHAYQYGPFFLFNLIAFVDHNLKIGV